MMYANIMRGEGTDMVIEELEYTILTYRATPAANTQFSVVVLERDRCGYWSCKTYLPLSAHAV